MRGVIRKWLFPSLEEKISKLSAEIDSLAAKVKALTPEPRPTLTAKDMMKPIHPFQVNRIPGRKLRADLEWKNSPEFKKSQELERERKAKQPQGAK